VSQVAEIALGNRIVSIVSVLPRRPLTCARPVMPRLTLCPSEWPRMSLRCISLCTTVCGRGPTMLMRPFRTLTKCGSSSSECRRRIRPRRTGTRIVSRCLPDGAAVLHAGRRAERMDLEFAAVHAASRPATTCSLPGGASVRIAFQALRTLRRIFENR